MIALSMLENISPLTGLRNALLQGKQTLREIARQSIERANGNASRNTYIYFDPDALHSRATKLQKTPAPERLPLYGIPISLKDCFDLAGTVTTCGSRYYAQHTNPAAADSGVAKRLLLSGALITGKTHLHPLAYGITGQNPDYGDCLQPRDATLLTGGSSSGAVASVQEGSALAAIGTDTGGSIRVPAALCGLTGYRASHQIASHKGWFPEAWLGAAHLAPSFDTVGFVLRDPRDLAPIAEALFAIPAGEAPKPLRVGIVDKAFLSECEKEVFTGFEAWKIHLTAMGASMVEFDTNFCNSAMEIFAAIQAHEAATIHRDKYDYFEASIRDRLRWGASLTNEDVASLHRRLISFQISMLRLFESFDFLMLPAAPISRLFARADHAETRSRILRYTTLYSMPGLPAISLPGEIIDAPFGTGVQIAAAPGQDPMLLAFAAAVGKDASHGHGKNF
jgi:Asp-tRNA(Asn)/Glu-tRNA(Gln) amidotransferase A subunit family amidase